MINNDLIEQKVNVLIKSLEPVVYEINQNKDLPKEKLTGIWHKHKERMSIEREGLLGLLLEDLEFNNINNNESQQGEAKVLGTVFFEKTDIAIDIFYQKKVKPLIYS